MIIILIIIIIKIILIIINSNISKLSFKDIFNQYECSINSCC